MKLRFFIYLIVFFLLGFENDDFVIKDNIKSMKLKYITPSYKNGKIVLDKINAVYEIKYLSGLVIEELEKDSNLKVINYKSYEYLDSKDKIIDFCKKYKNIDEYLSNDDISYICNKRRSELMEIKFEKIIDNSIFKIYLKLKEKNGFSINSYDMDYNFLEKEVVVLDKNKEIVEKKNYGLDGRLLSRTSFKKSKLVRYIIQYGKDENIEKYIKEEYRVDNTIRKKTETTYSFSGNINLKIETDYNTAGLKEKEFYYDSNNVLYRKYLFEYEIDDRGNWIKQIKFSVSDNGKIPQSIILREIVYL